MNEELCQNVLLRHISAMTPAHVGYITEFVWGQRHAQGEFREVSFLGTYTTHLNLDRPEI